jgi:hypothetical protein
MKTAEDYLRSKHYVPSESIPFNEVADFLREYAAQNVIEYSNRLREAGLRKDKRVGKRKKP